MWTIPWEHAWRGSIQVLYFNGKTLPSPPPFFSLFFLIGRVCRKFITHIGQGDLHVFLEIFLALDLTTILALFADGWISHPSPFHKTQRHTQEFETLSCFSVPSSLLPYSLPSYLVALLANGGYQAAFCVLCGHRDKEASQSSVYAGRAGKAGRWGINGGKHVRSEPVFPVPPFQLWLLPLKIFPASAPAYVENRIPVTHCLPMSAFHVWSWSANVFVSLPSNSQVTLQLFLPFFPQTCC